MLTKTRRFPFNGLARATRRTAVAALARLFVWTVLVGIATPLLFASSLAAQPAAPTSTSLRLGQAELALLRGHYERAEGLFLQATRSRGGAKAWMGLARVQLETGRHDDAYRSAMRVAGPKKLRTAARTLAAEALIARGRLDEAERALRALVSWFGAHRARVVLGRLLDGRGQRKRARKYFARVVAAYNAHRIRDNDGPGMALVAMAAWGLGALQDANRAFRDATRAAPELAQIEVEWARLFLEKYDARQALVGLKKVLRRNPNHAEALVLFGQARLAEAFDFAAAEQAVSKALRINPNLVRAHVLRAGMALRDMDIEQADHHLARALEVNPRSLLALSVQAAARFLADDEPGFAAAQQRVLSLNPRYSRLYSTIADYAEWEHRYPELVQLAQKALRIDPDDALAHAALGINLLRMGRERQGRRALQRAWKRDRFNVRVFNLLNLYDDVIDVDYVQFDAHPFRFRMHRSERQLLQRYLVPTLRQAYRQMAARYGFKPEGPVHVELYAHPEHFSLRTTGLPRAGVQGVCFGKVVTVLSPAGGPFNWGQITWHELAHVFHVQLSRNRVPRWFTEGLAEYETSVARDEWQREQDHRLWEAIVDDRIPSLLDFNAAFTRAGSMEQVMDAYYASYRLVRYVVERFGFGKVVQLLKGWGEGRRTSELVASVLGTEAGELDRAFRTHCRRRLAKREKEFDVRFARYADLPALEEAARNAPRNPAALAGLAAGCFRAGKHEQATQHARSALELDPANPIAHFVLARLAVASRRPFVAARHLKRIVASGQDSYVIRLLLGHSALARRRFDAARKQLDAAIRLDPERLDAWQALLRLAGAVEDTQLRLRALKALAILDQHGREVSAELLTLLEQQQAWNELVRYGEMARFVDPARAESHRLLAMGYLHSKRPKEALQELGVALTTGHPRPGLVHLGRANALLALGQRKQARRAARRAIRANASLHVHLKGLLGR